MKWVDENCGNCYYFLSKDKILESVKNPENIKAINDFLDIDFDTGHRCVRNPEPIETVETYWCGEWKKDIVVKSEVEEAK